MNLVVVARQPEVGERSAETISRLTGRHPSRTLIVQGADPDGPPWIDARIQAHCVMPRAGRARDVHGADLPDGRRRDRSPPVRPRRAAPDPRPARHRVVARRAAARVAARPRPARGDRPPRRRRRRAGRATASIAWSSWPACTTTSTRLSIRDFALVRQSRWREAIATVFDQPDFLPFLHSSPPDRGDLRDPRRDRCARERPTSSSRCTTSRGWPRGWGCGSRHRSRRRAEGPRRLPSPPRFRPGEKPPLHRGLQGRLKDQGGEVSVVIRPIASPMPPGTTLRVEILAERRGSELRDRRHRRGRERPRPRLARRRPGDGPDVQGAAPERGRPAERGARGRRPRPAHGRDDADGGRAGRLGTMSDAGRRTGAPRAAVRRRRRRRPPRPRSRSASPGRSPRAASRTGSTTGGSAAPGDLPPPRPLAAARDRRLVAGPRLVGRRPVRPARPSPLERPAVHAGPAHDRRRRGGRQPGVRRRRRPGRRGADPRGAHPPVPDDRGDRARRRAGVGRDRLRERPRAAGPRPTAAARRSTSWCWASGPTGTSCRCSRARPSGTRETVVGVPAPTHIEPHVDRVTMHPRLVAPARRVVVAAGGSKAEVLARAWAGADARELPVGAARRPERDVDPRRGRRRRPPAPCACPRRSPTRRPGASSLRTAPHRRLLGGRRTAAAARPRHDRRPSHLARGGPGAGHALAPPRGRSARAGRLGRRSIGVATPARPAPTRSSASSTTWPRWSRPRRRRGRPVDVVGHSLGGRIALGASLGRRRSGGSSPTRVRRSAGRRGAGPGARRAPARRPRGRRPRRDAGAVHDRGDRHAGRGSRGVPRRPDLAAPGRGGAHDPARARRRRADPAAGLDALAACASPSSSWSAPSRRVPSGRARGPPTGGSPTAASR